MFSLGRAVPTLQLDAARSLLAGCRHRQFAPGQQLYAEDQEGLSLWLLRRGTVELFKSFFGERHRLSYVSRGAVFGEGSLFNDEARSHSALAVTEVRAIEVPNSWALEQLEGHAGLGISLLRAVVGRTRQVEQSLVEQLVQRNLELQVRNSRLESRLKRRLRDLEMSNQDLNQMAWTDALTGCHNRRSLQKLLQLACEGDKSFAVAMFDVDNFKHYNDTHGHPAGDTALRMLAELLGKRLRGDDILARYGGEEFCLLLRELQAEQAAAVCERLRRAITDHVFPFEESQPLGDFTVSMGLAMFGVDGDTPEKLLAAADERLYQAKRQGRNRLVSGAGN